MPTIDWMVTAAALAAVSALLGGSLYDTRVLAPNLQAGGEGLEHGRLFLSRATPANLFRPLSMLTQILLLAALAFDWEDAPVRWPLVAALLATLTNDAITFGYHYPRNRLMFTAPLEVPPERLANAARQWRTVNYVRVLLVAVSWLLVLTAVNRLAVLGHL